MTTAKGQVDPKQGEGERASSLFSATWSGAGQTGSVAMGTQGNEHSQWNDFCLAGIPAVNRLRGVSRACVETKATSLYKNKSGKF